MRKKGKHPPYSKACIGKTVVQYVWVVTAKHPTHWDVKFVAKKLGTMWAWKKQ